MPGTASFISPRRRRWRRRRRKHFFGQTGLFLIAVDADALGDALRWEPSRNDELFPHLYGELDLGAVTGVLNMRARSDGYHDIPELDAVIRAFDAFSLPLLRWFDPEDAHRMAIQGLRLLPPMRPRPDDPKLAVRAFGLNFPNPIGMAAGFDKSAEVPDALLRLGFGFVEIGIRDAEAASRQSAAAAVPAGARRGRGQPHGLQQ